VDSGHGTHVALSVVGDGAAGGLGRGTAPGARLVFQAVEDFLDWYGLCNTLDAPDGYYLPGIPEDLGELYQQAYAAGARIHSNSWGVNDAGEYSTQSAQTDDFIWRHPDMAITFSAGNAGVDANGDGVVDDDSIGSPATAKNVITVGASENDRQGNYACDTGLGYPSRDAYQPNLTCGDMGGQNILGEYGTRWAENYPADPLASDLTAGNAEQMASFSSRGPTDDGRIKPDVVAPGTWVLSGYSALFQEGYGDTVNAQTGDFQLDGWGMPVNAQYKYFGGTSMSNPLTAGAATVARDFYQKAHGHNASAALVKATVINSAVDMLDENNDGADDNDFPIPNMHEGWGRVNVAAATDGNHLFFDEASGVHTADSVTYQVPVATAGAPLRISLVWSDFPAATVAASTLVNDLDLTATAPDGTVYLGNVFAGGWSQTGGAADRVNNVENVYVAAASPGAWTVQVTGYNVPMGPQPFALVIDGDFAQVDTPPSVAFVNPTPGSTISGSTIVQIEAADAEDAAGALAVEWAVDDGDWQSAPYNAATGYYEAPWDSTSSSDGSHVLRARATDSASNVTTTEQDVVVQNASGAVLHIGDLDARSSRGLLRWSAAVLITVHDAADNPMSDATVHGTWSTGGSGLCTTDGAGQCDVAQTGLWRNMDSVTFRVADISRADDVYDPNANHDPDGDSDGTQITVQQPGRALFGENEQGAAPDGESINPIYLPLITN